MSFYSPNYIRTSLLITVNNELNHYKLNNHNSFLINSKPLKEYEKSYENFFILEKDSITGTVGTYRKETFSYRFYKIPQKDKLFLIDEPIMPTNKIRLSKNISYNTKRKKTKYLTIHNRIEYETKMKFINDSIKSLRFFCSHLKDINYKPKLVRTNSDILRRKKYNKIGSNSFILSVKSNELKTEKKIKKKQRQSLIQLHKMWNDKKENKKGNLSVLENDFKETPKTSREKPKLFFND
jgi:hypothetical protein